MSCAATSAHFRCIFAFANTRVVCLFADELGSKLWPILGFVAPLSHFSWLPGGVCSPFTSCLPLAFLQIAAAARIVGKRDILDAAGEGDIVLVRDHLIADPASVNMSNGFLYDTRRHMRFRSF